MNASAIKLFARSPRLAALGLPLSLRVFASDLVGYGLCSAGALALDWSLLVVLAGHGMNYLAASATSFMAGMVFAYVGSIFFVFRNRRARRVVTEIAGFLLIGFAGLALNQVLIFLFVHFCDLHVGLAKAPTALLVFMFNFLLRRALLFAASPA